MTDRPIEQEAAEDEWLTAEEFDDHLEYLANLGKPRDPFADAPDLLN